MDEHISKTIEQAQRKLAEYEQSVVETKKFINQLCGFAGVPAMYPIVEEKQSGIGLGAIRSDTFYGKVVTTAAREYLEMRKSTGLGAATHGEIIEALKTGGFDFRALSPDDAIAQRTVAITMGKNSSIFHKLPNGNWGLLAWYPDARERKQKKDAATEKLEQASSDPISTDSPAASAAGTQE